MNKRIGIMLGSLVALVCILISVIVGLSSVPDQGAPYFVGVKDIRITEGDTIAYRAGVTAYDASGKEIAFEVHADGVNAQAAGRYKALYSATDQNGKTVTQEITVTVDARPNVVLTMLNEIVDQRIEEHGMRLMSRRELAEFLYDYIKDNTAFVSDSDKSDWVGEAYRALTEGEGDCFTYAAVAIAFFNRCGVETITVERSPNARPSTHYWLLVNMGTSDAPVWYHWDCCPHYREYPFYSCLVTDDELLAYNEKVENYYLFDMSLYPRTPVRSYG